MQQSSSFRLDLLHRQTVQWQRIGTPKKTLFGYGADAAKRALESNLMDLEGKATVGRCSQIEYTLFRNVFRQEIVRPLILRLERNYLSIEDSMLTEEELEGLLVSSLQLYRRMAVGCPLEDLFATRGGSASWLHCEELDKEVEMADEGAENKDLDGSNCASPEINSEL